MGDISYFTPIQHPVASFSVALFPSLVEHSTPITILTVQSDETQIIHTPAIDSVVRQALDVDDVLTPAWLENIVLVPRDLARHGEVVALGASVMEDLQELYGVSSLAVYGSTYHSQADQQAVFGVRTDTDIQSLFGPYIAVKENDRVDLLPVYRLYSDIYRTFITGVYPVNDGTGRYNVFPVIDARGYRLIPVPSRLYFDESTDNGVQGKRIGVKGKLECVGYKMT
jgi:hypothetical protein